MVKTPATRNLAWVEPEKKTISGNFPSNFNMSAVTRENKELLFLNVASEGIREDVFFLAKA